MKFIFYLFSIFCCLCSCAQSQNISGRPDAVRIGAQFARNSTIGRVAAVAVLAAVNDINNDSNILPGTKLDLHMHDSSCNRFLGIVQALQFMEKDTVAIIGPLSSTTAHVLSHLANELHVPLMSFSATDPTLSSLEYPFFVRTTVSDQFQMTAVADLVEYYGWKQVTTIFVDNDYGRNAISSLGDELSKRRSKILYKAPFRPGASNNEIADVLIKVAMMESRVIILHANPDSGLVVFQQALKLGMVSNGYAWIATDWLTSYLDPSVHLDIGLLSTMQGVLTLRHHTENTRRKSMLSSKWSELLKEDSGHSRFLLSTYGLYAYDTVWMLAHALDAFFNSGGNISFSPDPKLNEISGRGLNLEALSVFDGGQLLLEKIHQVDFLGATGPVKFDSGGNLIQPAYDIVSIIGSGLRTVGYWSNYSGLSVISPETLYKKPANRTRETQKLHDVIWPGETINKPRGWVFPNNGNEIKIGVPDRVSYRQFVSVDSETGMVRGLCIDVFVAAINLLAYPVPYRFVPFGNNRENPSYLELINKIITDDFDAVVGDVTIVTNRTKVVDFTQPYVSSGLVVLTSVKRQNSGGWAFLQPFTIKMWTVTGLFFLIIGTVVWMLEHRINDEFRGPPAKQLITVFWFSFSTLFFAHREDTRSTLGRFVIIIWLFVVLIIQSSYTASLTSILTVQQLTSPITGIDSLITSDVPIGFQVGSFAENYLAQELGVAHSRLKALGSPEEYKKALDLGPSKGGVAAIVDERPYIELFLYQNPKFAVVGSEFTKSGWGFAFPRDSPLSVDLSTAILELSENGDLQRIHDKWLASDMSSMSQASELDQDPDRLDVYSFSALFLICGLACIFALAIHACNLFYQYSRHAAEEDPAALQPSASDGSRSLSRRSKLQSFLSFADRREADIRRAAKEKAAGLGGSGGSMSGVSFTSSGSGSTTASC
uniref:Glutamate receptor n=2 Tax=Oryza TaxID=4527 RepID=A0A0E0PD92_ORYRU